MVGDVVAECPTDTDVVVGHSGAGWTLTSIAAELGVSRQTVSRGAKAAGIVVPKRPPSVTRRRPHSQLDDPDWLANAYAGRTISDIAIELEVSPSTVSAALQRHGIPVGADRRACPPRSAGRA